MKLHKAAKIILRATVLRNRYKLVTILKAARLIFRKGEGVR